jgi:hypothetical protein
MSAPKDFVSRWSRLKREVNSARPVRLEVEGACEISVESQAGAGPAQHGNDAAAIEPFDEASLPPIDAIKSDTDIRAFLRSNVPADLTRAALHRAWTSDPAIRDFIGVAESQWDFNDPRAMLGFGLLSPADNAMALLEQAVGGCDSGAETVAELADLDQSAQGKRDRLPVTDVYFRETPNDGRSEDAATSDNRIGDSDVFTRLRHGSAVPR